MNTSKDDAVSSAKLAITRIDTRLQSKATAGNEPMQKPIALLHRWLADHQPSVQSGKRPTPGQRSYCALFNGPSGTGKTIAAVQLARESELPLYRIDLSKLVSSYIGETEKNIDAVFEQADQQPWILFFDEADSLFGKRTEVKDAQDRYANQETSYLLQRIEAHPGLAILSTNIDEPVDEKFLRHFQAVVQFR